MLVGADPTSISTWFIRFVNSTFQFAAGTTALLVFLTLIARWLTKADHERMEVADFEFGVDFLIGAAVSVPSAVAFRVAKSIAAMHETPPPHFTPADTTIAFGALLLAAILLLMAIFARIEGRRRGRRVLISDLSLVDVFWQVLVPDLAGIGAVAIVLLFGSLGGMLKP